MKWSIIPSSNSLYEASSCGRIRRVGGRVLSQKRKKNGYMEVNLYLTPNKGTSKYVHRLVAETFIGEINQGMIVNHLDFNKGNNSIENLEIVTYSENSKHAYDNGVNSIPIMKGECHPLAKLSEVDVIKMREMYSNGVSPKYISNKFNTPYSTVCKILYRQTWKHV